MRVRSGYRRNRGILVETIHKGNVVAASTKCRESTQCAEFVQFAEHIKVRSSMERTPIKQNLLQLPCGQLSTTYSNATKVAQ